MNLSQLKSLKFLNFQREKVKYNKINTTVATIKTFVY